MCWRPPDRPAEPYLLLQSVGGLWTAAPGKPQLPPASGFGSFGTLALVNSDPEEVLMAAPSQDVHRRRVLEHQAKLEADRSTPVPVSVPSSPDPQLKIRLIGEVRRSDESVAPTEPKRGRQRSRKRTQPDLGV
jgi:hypothetical protein